MRPYKMAALRVGAGGILSLIAAHASAFPFELGPFEGRLDTTVSAGVTLRMQDRDAALMGIANGGTARSVNDDDGNYGFDKGDVVSAVAKATHDLEFKHGNYGLFTRFSYFYDQAAADADRLENRLTAGGGNLAARDRELGQYELGRRGRERLEKEGDLLDLFVYGRFDVGGRALSARFGKQVVSWGESTFIGNSINSINPIDVARIRSPGAELKEALIPTAMAWASFQIADNASLEAVWLTEYEKTRIDPRGSFFSTNDFASDDGNKAIVSFGRRRDDNRTIDPVNAPGSVSAWVGRESGPSVEDAEKQYGVALRYFAENFGNTEFGLYYLTLHSRVPLVSGVRGAATNPANLAAPTCSSDASDPATCRASYFAEFPSNIDLYGISFNTDGPWGIAVQGEYSYRPELPLQLAGTEVLLTALGVPSTISAAPVAAGTYVQGYREVEAHQAQVTLTKAFGPTFGAQQFLMLGEVGYNHFDLPENLRFNGPGAGLPSCGPFRALPAGNQAAVSNGSCQEEVGGGYGTSSSWGYRLVSRLDFENAIGPMGISPRLVFAHDVNGVGPNFNQDAKAITVGVAFNYLQRWQADIGYTTFFGGRTYSGTDPVPPGTDINPDPNVVTLTPGDSTQSADFATSANPNKDRDFLAISLSYAF
ncbi:MAG TPA: DUF1302 domain-containing protein [Solimonas sp.]